MIKVSGVTFCHTTNYGSSLQAYALQKAVESMEINGEPCRYELIRLWDCKDYPRIRIKTPKAIPVYFYQKLSRHRFSKFENETIHFRSVKTLADLDTLNCENDAFVCGSDVIWNPEFNHELGAYYLDFAKKYKFSYAASFGKAEIPEDKLQKIGGWLSELDQIGVREKSGAEIARRFTDAPVEVVSDPVLLLSPEEWNQVAAPPVKKEKYIFVYTTHINPTFEAFLKKLEQETGLKVVLAIWTLSFRRALKTGILLVQKQPEWLRMIRDAEYVVTNSFHATVFSVMFEKKVFTVVGGKKDQGINVRMYDFLSGLGLHDRILDEVPETIDLGMPDYKTATPRLNALRDRSAEFLRRNLENAALSVHK